MSQQQWIRYTIDLTPDAWAALLRHGYRPELPPRGVGGGPEVIESGVYGARTRAPTREALRATLAGMSNDGSSPALLPWNDVPEEVRAQVEYARAHPELSVPRGPRRERPSS